MIFPQPVGWGEVTRWAKRRAKGAARVVPQARNTSWIGRALGTVDVARGLRLRDKNCIAPLGYRRVRAAVQIQAKPDQTG